MWVCHRAKVLKVQRGTKLQRGTKVKNGTSQPEVLIGSMPESQKSKCQESTGWPGGQIITRFGNQFWAKVKWLVATEEKARRPGGAQGAKMTRFWKVIKNKINCLGFPRAAEACQSENFVGEQGSKATLSVQNIGWWEDLQHILYFHTVQFWSKNW